MLNTFHIFSHYFLVNTLYIQQSCKLNESSYKIEGINSFKDLHVISSMGLTDSDRLARKATSRQATGHISTHSAFLTHIWWYGKNYLTFFWGNPCFSFWAFHYGSQHKQKWLSDNSKVLKLKKNFLIGTDGSLHPSRVNRGWEFGLWSTSIQ